MELIKGEGSLRLQRERRLTLQKSRPGQLQLRKRRWAAAAVDAHGNFQDGYRCCCELQLRRLRCYQRQPGARQIDLRVVMPGTGGAILVSRQRMARMIMLGGKDQPHAHVERADDRCYPTPSHSKKICAPTPTTRHAV